MGTTADRRGPGLLHPLTHLPKPEVNVFVDHQNFKYWFNIL